MAFDINPDDFFGSAEYTNIDNGATVSVDGPAIVFKSSGATAGSNLLSSLTDADADETTGDVREVVFALCEAVFSKMDALATADKSNKLTVTRNTFEDTVNDEFVRTYTFQLRLAPPSFSVKAES
tara:strand:+ start:577 stop:951 length:375 start_codon:yes stop_codon:yes gene_type:complete